MLLGLSFQERTSLALKTIHFCFNEIKPSYSDTIIMVVITENSPRDQAIKQAQSSRKSAAHKNSQRSPKWNHLLLLHSFENITTCPDFSILSQIKSGPSTSLTLATKIQLCRLLHTLVKHLQVLMPLSDKAYSFC